MSAAPVLSQMVSRIRILADVFPAGHRFHRDVLAGLAPLTATG
ncbi:hypothetical protein [Actinocrinis puniceicyclus]|nr:hypothetical protein [Actinocrinis puniceicyclus]